MSQTSDDILAKIKLLPSMSRILIAALLLIALVNWSGATVSAAMPEHHSSDGSALPSATSQATAHEHSCCPHLARFPVQVIPTEMPCGNQHSCCVKLPADSPALPVQPTSPRSKGDCHQATESRSALTISGFTVTRFVPDTSPFLEPSLLGTVLRI